jgi:hypothetical protein
MNSNVKSQIDRVIASYIGKSLMILVPSQSLQEGAVVKGNHRGSNTREGLPYSYTTGRDWCRHRIHGLVGAADFGMELICWQPDRLDDLQVVAAWYVQEYGFHQVLFISLKSKAKIWNYEDNRITGHVTLGSFQAEHIETYGQMLVDDSHSIDQVYVCKSIGDEYRQVRAPHCDRSHLENFGQLSNHLGADHILFVPDLTHVVHGRTMQQYLVFLDVPYDKVYHTFDAGESFLYHVLYVRQCKLKTVLDVLELLFENEHIKPMIYVTPEGNLYELGPDMAIQKNCGVFCLANYESIFTQSEQVGLCIQIDADFQYNRPSMFMRMGGATILSRLIN